MLLFVDDGDIDDVIGLCCVTWPPPGGDGVAYCWSYDDNAVQQQKQLQLQLQLVIVIVIVTVTGLTFRSTQIQKQQTARSTLQYSRHVTTLSTSSL